MFAGETEVTTIVGLRRYIRRCHTRPSVNRRVSRLDAPLASWLRKSFDNHARGLGAVIMTHWRRTACAFASVLIMFSAAPAPVRAQDESELATKTQNPLADLISVRSRTTSTLASAIWTDVLPNIQAVIPFRLTDECNLITRTTAPVIYRPSWLPASGKGSDSGTCSCRAFFCDQSRARSSGARVRSFRTRRRPTTR